MAQPPEYSAPPGMPRWVKIFGIVALVLIVIVVIILVVGGNHGPGRHLGGSRTQRQIALTGPELRPSC